MRGETPRWEPIILNFSDPREARLTLTTEMPFRQRNATH
jgi:hypothetical protein